MSKTIPKEVLGEIFSFIPESEIKKLLAKKDIPDILLLDYPIKLSREVCARFKIKEFDILMKNQNIDRNELLQCVSFRGLIDKVKILLREPKVDPSADYNAALNNAAKGNHINVFKLLLSNKRVKDIDFDIFELLIEIEDDIEDYIISLLHSNKIDRDLDAMFEIIIEFLLPGAFDRGYFKLIRALLDPKILSEIGYSNIEEGRIRMLLGRNDSYEDSYQRYTFGGDDEEIEPKDEMHDRMIHAIKNNYIGIIKLYLESEEGKTMLTYYNSNMKKQYALTAVEYGNLEIFKLLVSNEEIRSADVGFYLYLALEYNRMDILNMILKGGFSPQEKDDRVIAFAYMKGMNKIVRILMKYYGATSPGSMVDIIKKRLK